MQLMIYIHYCLQFSRMLALNTQQHLKEELLILSRFFTFFTSLFSFLLPLFKLSCKKKHQVYNLYCISYTLTFCYVMYYILLEIRIGGCFLEDSCYCYSQQVIFVVANASLIPYNFTKRTPETQNL